MAQRRVGAGANRTIAAQRSLGDGLALLTDTVYGPRLAGCTSRAAAEHAIRATALWQLRVLGGWFPAAGTRLVRAVAAEYERDNIVALAAGLTARGPAPEFFELGSLATAWPRVRAAHSLEELAESLRTSRWGDIGHGDTIARRDILTLAWLGRLASVAPAARSWARAAGGLTVARVLLADRSEPSARFLQVARPLVGEGWARTGSLPALREALPRPAREALAGIDRPEDLWRAEARLRATVEADGFRLLRGALPGPEVVLGAIALIAMDGWRVRAALAAAATGAGSSEVLDAVA